MPLLDRVSKIVNDAMPSTIRSTKLNRRYLSSGILKRAIIYELELESRFNPDILPSTDILPSSTKLLRPAKSVKVPGHRASIQMLRQ